MNFHSESSSVLEISCDSIRESDVHRRDWAKPMTGVAMGA